MNTPATQHTISLKSRASSGDFQGTRELLPDALLSEKDSWPHLQATVSLADLERFGEQGPGGQATRSFQERLEFKNIQQASCSGIGLLASTLVAEAGGS